MEPEKLILGFVIFTAVLSFLPLVGVSNLATQQVPPDIYFDENGNELVNSTSAIVKIDIAKYAWDIILPALSFSIIAGIMTKIAGVALSGGMLIAYAIFFGFFVSMGINALRVINNLINVVGSGVPTAQPILIGILAIFSLVFIYVIFIYIKRIAAGAYE